MKYLMIAFILVWMILAVITWPGMDARQGRHEDRQDRVIQVH